MNIRIRDIAKEFGDCAALRGVDLDIASGDLVALLGPSGSGKTTLLRIIAGLITAERGTIHFGDLEASHIPVRERQVGFVFQHYALFRHMTVAENIAFGLSVRPRAKRPSRAERLRRVGELLELVQLGGFEKRYPAQLSGGQRQRVALARALAVEPRVLLLDEPFGALDAQVRKDLRRWLRTIHEQVGCTTVFVTHDQEEALELADRVAVLNQGKIEQWGTPDQIYDHPATPFVHEFIGETNCLPVTFQNGKAWLHGQELPIHGIFTGKYGTLYVRHQDWSIAPVAGAVLRGVVERTTRSGARRRIDVNLGNSTGIVIDAQAHQHIETGMEIGVVPSRWQIFLVDGTVLHSAHRTPATIPFVSTQPQLHVAG
jgi:sulfate transport system ATP-binding protein